jgi:hypothetical protein
MVSDDGKMLFDDWPPEIYGSSKARSPKNLAVVN